MSISDLQIPKVRRVFNFQPDDAGYRLEATEAAVPELGANEVLVRIEAVSLNYRDLLIKRGHLGPVRSGLTALSDGAGRVIAVGSSTSRWRIGDHVAPIFYQNWKSGSYEESYFDSGLGAGDTDGVMADIIAIPEDALVALPAGLDSAQGATLPCAAVTAWHALVVRGGLSSGDTLLVQGTGGVSLFGLQIANALGARTIVLSSSEEKLERAAALGAFATINYRSVPDWDVEVRKITDGRGVSHILEVGGPDTFERSLKSIAAGGRIAQIGLLTGFGPQSNILRVQFVNATIDGINVGSREHFESMNKFFADHAIKPVIDRTFAFSEAAEAFEMLEKGAHFGKLVLRA